MLSTKIYKYNQNFYIFLSSLTFSKINEADECRAQFNENRKNFTFV